VNVELPKDGSNPLLDNLPNTITPNGDGKNDQFVFDVIINPTEEFPDNQIIIFNRWGDIVYEAMPYANNWDGTNDKGQDLPQGTYYYILRLDVANGIILIGGVTILR
jgi:gliding motility-associated-like protein